MRLLVLICLLAVPMVAMSAPTEGRYRVVNAGLGQPPYSILLDTETGKTWASCTDAAGTKAWCEMPRLERARTARFDPDAYIREHKPRQ